MKNLPVNVVRVFFYIWILLSIVNIGLDFQFMTVFTTFMGLVIVSAVNIIVELVFPIEKAIWDNRRNRLVINSVLLLIILTFIITSNTDKYLLILMIIPVLELFRVIFNTETNKKITSHS